MLPPLIVDKDPSTKMPELGLKKAIKGIAANKPILIARLTQILGLFILFDLLILTKNSQIGSSMIVFYHTYIFCQVFKLEICFYKVILKLVRSNSFKTVGENDIICIITR